MGTIKRYEVRARGAVNRYVGTRDGHGQQVHRYVRWVPTVAAPTVPTATAE